MLSLFFLTGRLRAGYSLWSYRGVLHVGGIAMKILFVPAIMLLALPGTTVRFESDGIRVGDEVVSGKTIGLKTSGDLPILVSGTMLENLSSSGRALEVAVDSKKVLLDVGLRMERQGEGYKLATHGPSFSVEAGGKTILLESEAGFKVTEKGFDFGKQGTLEGSELVAKVSAVRAIQEPSTTEPPTSYRSRTRQQANRAQGLMQLVFGFDPTVSSEAADSQAIRDVVHVSPVGSP